MGSFNRNILLLGAISALVYFWVWSPPQKTKVNQAQPDIQDEGSNPASNSKKVSPPAAQNKAVAAEAQEAKADAKPALPEADPLKADFTVAQFKQKFKDKKLQDWLQESRPFDYADKNKIVPNVVEGFLLKDIDGNEIRYRQAMGLDNGRGNLADCVSFLPPGGQPIVGTMGDGTLEVRETAVKWTYIVIVKNRHYFLEHIAAGDTSELPYAAIVLFYYQRNKNGDFQFKGEKIGRDEIKNFSTGAYHICNNTY